MPSIAKGREGGCHPWPGAGKGVAKSPGGPSVHGKHSSQPPNPWSRTNAGSGVVPVCGELLRMLVSHCSVTGVERPVIFPERTGSIVMPTRLELMVMGDVILGRHPTGAEAAFAIV